MIIVDFNQVMLSNLLMQIGNHTNSKIEENMVRHMVLNSLRSYRNKFGSEFGEMIIACDNTNYWRKKIFPYYKANRKKNIEKSEQMKDRRHRQYIKHREQRLIDVKEYQKKN